MYIDDFARSRRMTPLVSLLVYLSIAQMAVVGLIALVAVISISKDEATKPKSHPVLSSH